MYNPRVGWLTAFRLGTPDWADFSLRSLLPANAFIILNVTLHDRARVLIDCRGGCEGVFWVDSDWMEIDVGDLIGWKEVWGL